MRLPCLFFAKFSGIQTKECTDFMSILPGYARFGVNTPFEYAVFSHEAPRRSPLRKATEIRPPLPGRKGGCMEKAVKPIRVTAGWQDNTIYIIEYATSDNAKETAYEKVKRLIMNEPITSQKQAS